VLVLYNADSYGAADGCDSTDLMSYYKNNRPGMANATYLGISAAALDAIYHNLSVNGITSIPDNEPDYDGTIANQDPQKSMRISAANWRVCLDIGQYVASWIENNCPTIRYVVGLAGLPSRSDDYWCSDDAYGGFSVSYSIYQNCLATTHGTGYAGGTDRFSVAEYGAPLVAWLDCGTYAATRAYINKEISTANAGGLQSDGITISGNAAGVGGSTWVLDDAHHDYQTDLYQDYLVGPGSRFDFSDALYADQVNGTITVSADDYTIHWPNSQPAITNVANPTAYTSWGVHSGTLTSNWPDNGQVTFTGNAGWWIGTSVESYNGVYGDDMGDPTKVFAAMAFGGTNYSNTPICWVGSTAEPGGKWSGNSAYFDRWAKGSSPLEAAWSSITYAPGSSTAYILAVTDVFLQP
jgi:hypothetical protein